MEIKRIEAFQSDEGARPAPTTSLDKIKRSEKYEIPTVSEAPAKNVQDDGAVLINAHGKLSKGLGANVLRGLGVPLSPARGGRRHSVAQTPWQPSDILTPDRVYEQIAASMAEYDKARNQPALPYESMFYTRNAANYGYGHAPHLPLWGLEGQAAWHHVRIDLEGAMGAVLATLAAVRPEHFGRILTPSKIHGIFEVALHMPSTGQPELSTPIKMRVDNQVPVDGAGHIWGGAPAAWPLLTYKALAKLQNVLAHVYPGENLHSFAAILQMLTGQRGIVTQADAAHRLTLTPGAPAIVTFCDILEMSQTVLPGASVQPALCGQGLRVRSFNKEHDLVLLAAHPYSVIGFDKPTRPTLVQLYNPLGDNPSAKHLHAHMGSAGFFNPEDYDTLAKTAGAFWMPVHWLSALGTTMSVGHEIG